MGVNMVKKPFMLSIKLIRIYIKKLETYDKLIIYPKIDGKYVFKSNSTQNTP
jgi:hypothetical protein